MGNFFTTILFVLLTQQCIAQIEFINLYPLAEHPNMGYKTSMVPDKEQIIFEANPNIYPSLYNNIYPKLVNGGKNGYGINIVFRPQLRMYNDNSKPVRMPSYKIGLGGQWIKRLTSDSNFKYQTFLSFALETGHFSNGQIGSTFSEVFEDGSRESDSVYQTINDDSDLSQMLNRKNGNFSTNYTEVGINYRKIWMEEEEYKPTHGLSFSIKYTLFHDRLGLLLFTSDLGGYTEQDIAIYGKHRIGIDASYFHLFQKRIPLIGIYTDRLAYDLKANVIAKPHPSVNPFRTELTGTLYFKNDVGIFVSFIYGHDNYNIRFLDSGFQFFTGVTFDLFNPKEVLR